MKTQKLIVIGAIVCLLVSAPGAAMASECLAGYIINEIVEFLTVSGTDCFVTDTIVLGDVKVTNSPNFVMLNSRVYGSVTVTGGGAVIGETTVANGASQAKILVEETINDTVILNNVVHGTGDMVIRNNIYDDPESQSSVIVYENIVGGDITCANNTKVLAIGNIAAQGIRGCPGQIFD